MKTIKAEFYRSVFSSKDFPKDNFPQIAFAGRSNVGKSSMINCLLGKKILAKISSLPGKTRSINYLKINGRFYFVDLPGYGYAKVSKTERNKWKTLIEAFFSENENFKGLIHIIDSRIGITANDENMLEFGQHIGFLPLIVATKADKLNQSEKSKMLHKIKKQLDRYSINQFFPFSAKSGLGRSELWHWIEEKL